MQVEQLLNLLKDESSARIHVMLPDRAFVPEHFHVTEVGLVRKEFIDCGGTIRTSAACVMQLWVADDLDHRLDTSKLLSIFKLALPILKTTDLPIEIEYEKGAISQYPLVSAELTPGGLLLELGTKHTACLAPELCGPGGAQACCGESGCC